MIVKYDKKYWQNNILKISDEIEIDLSKDKDDREVLSSNILKNIRHLVDSVVAFIYVTEVKKINDKRYDNIKEGYKYAKSNSEYNFISEFGTLLNSTVGHDVIIGEYAERLMQSYYFILIKLKDILFRKFEIIILKNIYNYPLDLDESTKKYYSIILPVVNKCKYNQGDIQGTNSYYIYKKKVLYIDGELFYEYTLSNATDYTNKFDRFTAFSKIDIYDNYAIRAEIGNDKIYFLEKEVQINIITNYWVAIRPCELEKVGKIFDFNYKISKTKEYYNLMEFIKNYKMNLYQIIIANDDDFEKIKNHLFSKNFKSSLLKLLSASREHILANKKGSNVLMYLLAYLKNSVIRYQLNEEKEQKVDELCLKAGVLPFDGMPFSASLLRHNPKFYDLVKVFNLNDYQYELIKRILDKNSIEDGTIYCSRDIFFNFDNLEENIKKFNKLVPSFQSERQILEYKNNFYIRDYELSTFYIIEFLLKLSKSSTIKNYKNYAKKRIEDLGYVFDDELKEKAIINMYEKSSVFLVYGAAGTGKTTLTNKLLNILGDIKKICIANTHAAVHNLREKINDNKVEYMTISKIVDGMHLKYHCDILVIDECSNVSNQDMIKILKKVEFKLLFLIGDVHQIEAISFGNWFNIICHFIKKDNYIELDKNYRAEHEVLKNLWNKVRTLSKDVKQILTNNQISHKLDESIFECSDEDDINLCLNYDGLYGINNINNLLQINNPNTPVQWGNHIYKENDPILFNDSKRFSKIFYNNLKGKIIKIEKEENKIYFTVSVHKVYNSVKMFQEGLEFLGVSDAGETFFKISVDKHKESDYDNDSRESTLVPFQVAYAVSIHKAQGLEYDKVKIIITDEIEEKITHNIFYTAITRAKKDLTIYWSPETEEKVLNSLKVKNISKDIKIIGERLKSISNKENYKS